MRVVKTTVLMALCTLTCVACGEDSTPWENVDAGESVGGDNMMTGNDTGLAGQIGADDNENDGSLPLVDSGMAGMMDEEIQPDAGAAGSMEEADAGTMDRPADGLPLDALVGRIAESACETLNRCCNSAEVDTFWSAIANNPRFEDVRETLPPQVPYDADTCVETLTRAYNIAPFGQWAGAATSGLVEYRGDEAAACLDALETAECGQGVLDTLYDGLCFGFQPPLGADRRAFPRSGTVGEPCMTIADGASGGFFGTCDPTQAWCANETANGAYRITPAGQMGTCIATTPVGDACGLFPSAAVCARGSNCSVDSVCEAEPELGPAQAGQPCWDSMTYTSLAACVDSFCDVTGNGVCVEFREDGDACSAGFECLSNNCLEGVCDGRTYCGGL